MLICLSWWHDTTFDIILLGILNVIITTSLKSHIKDQGLISVHFQGHCMFVIQMSWRCWFFFSNLAKIRNLSLQNLPKSRRNHVICLHQNHWKMPEAFICVWNDWKNNMGLRNYETACQAVFYFLCNTVLKMVNVTVSNMVYVRRVTKLGDILHFKSKQGLWPGPVCHRPSKKCVANIQ